MLALVLLAAVQAGMGIISSWVNLAGFEQLLRVLSLAFPFQAMATVATARLERALDFKRIAMVELSSQLIYYAIALPMALTGFGVWSLVCGWCVQQIATCAVLHIAARYVPRPAWNSRIVLDIMRYSLGFSLSAWTWQLRSLVNPFIVGHFLDAQAVGYVGLTVRVVEMMTIVKAIVWRLSVAAFARIQNEPAKLLGAIDHGMQLQMLAIAPPLLAFAWLGAAIIPPVLGAQWSPIMALFPFVALSYLINAQFNMHASALYVLNRNLDVFLFNLANVSLFALASWLAVPKLGIVGYGLAEVLAFVSYLILHLSVSKRLGSPRYGLVAIWFSAVTLGLFWKTVGPWAIAAPFAAILWPGSLARLRWFWETMRHQEYTASPSIETKP